MYRESETWLMTKGDAVADFSRQKIDVLHQENMTREVISTKAITKPKWLCLF